MNVARSQSGQITIEAVLILSVLLSIATYASQQFKSRGILQKLVGAPWSYTRGMIENGIWATTTPNPYHPNSKHRHASLNPDHP